MRTVFKREFRGFFEGAFGWMFTAALLFAAGVLTAVNNLLGLSSDVSRMYPVLTDLLILLLPLLAARTVTYDAAKGNLPWLHTLPVSRTSVLLGKYFAMLALLAIPALYFALFPPIIGSWGNVSYGTAYSSLLGWFLIAAAALGLCTLIATLTANRLLCLLFGVLACLVSYFLPVLAALISAVPWTGLLFLLLLAAGIAVPPVLREVRNNRIPIRGILLFAVLCLPAVLLFFLARRFYTRILPDLLDFLSVFGHLDGFRNGHFDLRGLCFLLSVTVLTLVLAAILPERMFRKGGLRHENR